MSAGHGYLPAPRTPYGLEPLVAVVCLVAWRTSRRQGGRLTPNAAPLGTAVGFAALVGSFLQLPADCDDPRIDEPEEKAAIVPGSER